MRALCWGRGEEWKRGWGGGGVIEERRGVCGLVKHSSASFWLHGIAALRRQR